MNTIRLPGAAARRPSKVRRTARSVRYWVTPSQTKNTRYSVR
ncbi:Uncharacterised protein [Mycobacterium tuberculosis]|nr:Uncharacterised protein [Mycobacterium tuberculosis]